VGGVRPHPSPVQPQQIRHTAKAAAAIESRGELQRRGFAFVHDDSIGEILEKGGQFRELAYELGKQRTADRHKVAPFLQSPGQQ
jgi:hypothetical protein